MASLVVVVLEHLGFDGLIVAIPGDSLSLQSEESGKDAESATGRVQNIRDDPVPRWPLCRLRVDGNGQTCMREAVGCQVFLPQLQRHARVCFPDPVFFQIPAVRWVDVELRAQDVNALHPWLRHERTVQPIRKQSTLDEAGAERHAYVQDAPII